MCPVVQMRHPFGGELYDGLEERRVLQQSMGSDGLDDQVRDADVEAGDDQSLDQDNQGWSLTRARLPGEGVSVGRAEILDMTLL